MFDLSIFDLDKHIGNYILIGQIGSKVYGTDTPESDDDFLGVAVAPLSHYTGLESWENDGALKIERKETHNAEMTVFEFRKFLKLCVGFNPNVIPLLYLDNYELTSFYGRMLIDIRDAFTSKRAYDTMIGYAKGQMKSVINGDTGKLGQKRKELVKIYGYDVKYASHTVRLLRMAIEFFSTGRYNVYRKGEDRLQLLEIRNGKWTLEEWMAEVNHLLAEAEKAEKESNFPDKPDFKAINQICMQIIEGSAYREDVNDGD